MKPTLIILIFLLIGCESKRAANKTEWLKRHGFLTIDSVIVKDTFITSHFDTTILHDSISEIDTVTINNVQVITKWKTREQRIIQKADTIITERIVPRVIYKPSDCPKIKWWDNWLVGAISAILFFILILLFLRYIVLSLAYTKYTLK